MKTTIHRIKADIYKKYLGFISKEITCTGARETMSALNEELGNATRDYALEHNRFNHVITGTGDFSPNDTKVEMRGVISGLLRADVVIRYHMRAVFAEHYDLYIQLIPGDVASTETLVEEMNYKLSHIPGISGYTYSQFEPDNLEYFAKAPELALVNALDIDDYLDTDVVDVFHSRNPDLHHPGRDKLDVNIKNT